MTAPTVFVLSGPNLNRLGTREPEIYGSDTLDDVHDAVTRLAHELGERLGDDVVAAHHEGEVVPATSGDLEASVQGKHQ